MSRLKELTELRAKALADARAFVDAADKEKRAMTKEENEGYSKAYDAARSYGEEIVKRQQLEAEEAIQGQSAGRSTGLSSGSPVLPSRQPQAIELDSVRGHRLSIAPDSRLFATASDSYRAAFARYLGTGKPSADLQTSEDTRGGYLAPVQMSNQIIKFLDNLVWMRQISNVLPPLTNAVSLGVPSWDTDPSDPSWTAEVPASAVTADTAAATGKREFVPHLLMHLVKISQKMMRASVVNIEQYIAQRFAYIFAIKEENAFLNGTGAQQPLGVFVASTNGISTSRDVTASATTSFDADNIIDTFMNLKAGYRARGSWVMHRDAVKRCFKLKDSSGQYLWNQQPVGTQLTSALPGTLLGRPVYESEYAPNTFTTGLYVALFGDFTAGYWIVDSLGMEMQTADQLYAATNQVGIFGRKETDGAPVLGEAFSRLKLA